MGNSSRKVYSQVSGVSVTIDKGMSYQNIVHNNDKTQNGQTEISVNKRISHSKQVTPNKLLERKSHSKKLCQK